MSELIRCKHHHTYLTHPACFIKNKKSGEWIIRDVPLSSVRWWENDGLRLAFLDIETSELKPNVGYMVSWAIKEMGNSKVITDNITKKDIFNYQTFDKKIVESLLNEMNKYDVFVTYYGQMFDAKFIRSRALVNGFEPPKYKQKLHIDLYWKAVQIMNLSSGSLDSVTKFFGIKGKTKLDIKYWKLASIGHQPSMEKLLIHNRNDVIILEKLFWKLEKYCNFERQGF